MTASYMKISKLLFVYSILATSLAMPGMSSTSLRTMGRIDSGSLGKAVDNPVIHAFDLSEDGRNLALLVTSGESQTATEWLLVVDTRTSQVLGKAQIGQGLAYVSQVLFTSDGRFLVVRDNLPEVRVLESASLAVVHRIEPPSDKFRFLLSISRSSGSDVIAVNFAAVGLAMIRDDEKVPGYTEIIDAAHGTARGSWRCDDIIGQVLSPDGSLAAIPDWSTGNAIAGISVVDTKSGAKVAAIGSGYTFKDRRPFDTSAARVDARFVTQTEIVLTPDPGTFVSGHLVGGQTLKLVRIPDGKVLDEKRPRRYGASIQAAASSDGRFCATLSLDVKLNYNREIPPLTKCDLMVFSLRDGIHLDETERLVGFLGLSGADGRDLLRISSNGSVIAVVQDGGITLFERR